LLLLTRIKGGGGVIQLIEHEGGRKGKREHSFWLLHRRREGKLGDCVIWKYRGKSRGGGGETQQFGASPQSHVYEKREKSLPRWTQGKLIGRQEKKKRPLWEGEEKGMIVCS